MSTSPFFSPRPLRLLAAERALPLPMSILTHPDLTWLDAIINSVWNTKPLTALQRVKLPLGTGEQEEGARALLSAARGFIASMDAPTYRRLSGKGWETGRVRISDTVELVMHRPQLDGHEAPLPVVVWCHGGGFVLSNAAEGWMMTLADEVLKRYRRAVWISVEYRLAPEHPFPSAFDDVALAIRHVATDAALAKAWNYDRSRLHVGGVSAGACLAACGAAAAMAGVAVQSLFLAFPFVSPENLRRPSPSVSRNGHLPICPTEFLAFGWRALLTDAEGREMATPAAMADPRVTPLAPGAWDAGLPPKVIVVTGKADALEDDGAALVRCLQEAKRRNKGACSITHVSARCSHALLLCDGKAADEVYSALAQAINPW